jgi:hypothetical protein
VSTYTGKYSDDRASDASFKRDTSIYKSSRAGEGDGGQPKYYVYAGGLSDRRKPVDSDLSSFRSVSTQWFVF